MSRYLVYTSPARGHLYPITETLIELQRRDHDVHVRTLASEVGRMRGLGFETAAIDAAIERREHDDWAARTPMGAQRRAIKTFLERAGLDAPDLRRAIDEVRPDVLYIDINTWGAMCVAEASGLPWAVFSPYSLPIASKDAPPFGLGLTPRRDVVGRVRDGLIRKLLFAPVERIVGRNINELRASLGVSPIRDATEFLAGIAPLLVYYSAEPFEYARSDWPPSVRLVGPGTWDPPSEPPGWLERVEKPLVLITCSTEFQDDGKLIETAFEALADEDLMVVATSGGVDTSDLEVPSGALVEPFLPHGPLLEQATCVVCHGGMGITQKALAAGVPVAVVPFGRDQFEVARRVVVARAGSRLPASRLNAPRLREAVREAMKMHEGARRVAAAFSAAGGAPAAADALEDLVSADAARPVGDRRVS
jgi:MGT family glycosyltransferase